MKKAAANPEEDKQNDVNAQKNFILGCIVFYDQIKQRSKQFAFVDFNCPEAA
jgi:RNA recognition motif-containing protein